MMYQLNLREVTYALCEALDYVGVDDTGHGKRVAYIACELGKKLGWRQSKLDKLMLMAMLHDCGISSSEVHHSIISSLDWEGSQVHCAKGAKILKSVPIYADFADTIAFHHTHWEQFLSQIDDDVKLSANLIFLSDRIDALRSQFGAHLSHEKEYIRSIIQSHTSSMFAPKLTQAFVELSFVDSFWYYLEPDPIHYYFNDWIEHGEIETVHFDLIKSIACMFAGIVNAKKQEIQDPTFFMASLARTIAELCQLPLREQEQIELAALFHDLGKLRIPDEILEKNRPLSNEEQSRIKRQGFDSQIILRQIKGFEQIAKIVSLHYKTVNEKEEGKVPLDAAILSMAQNVKTLLHQRDEDGSKCYAITALVQKMSRDYQLNTTIVDNITSHLARCYEKSTLL